MSDELNWDDLLGQVETEEKENPDKGDFDAIPKGNYNIVVKEAEKQVSKSGKDMIKVQVQITDGPYANRVLFNYIVFSPESPKAMRMTLIRLAAFGITREFIATTRPSIGAIADLLEGRKAVAVVGIQAEGEYKGTNEVKSFKVLEGVDQPAPQAAASKPAGVPSGIPTPNIPTPSVPTPTPSAPAAEGEENPFG
jgi:hypothetical protein